MDVSFSRVIEDYLKKTEYLKNLYQQVVSNYGNCEVNKAYLSDTWAHTLRQKGNRYSFDTMLTMLSLGNKVNSWIDDFNYMIDTTAIDLRDPIVNKLIQYGESDFGFPRKDVKLGDQFFSSNFIHHVLYASKIIHAIEARGIKEPAIMEIGGGVAGIPYLLRHYFKDKLTYYAVDLPETLLIQEWYLRGCFPSVETSYKPTRNNIDFRKGGFNFINAYVLESQDIPFDVAINIDSLQEMNQEAVNMYIGYIQRNISVAGIFYFQNHFGQSSSSIPEPSEYNLDENWTIKVAEIASQIECCSESEQARLVYYRTRKKEDVKTRKLILRVLWNGFISGLMAQSSRLTGELAKIPEYHSPRSAVSEIAGVFQKHGICIDKKSIASLQGSLYFFHKSFVSILNSEPIPIKATRDIKEVHMNAIWRTQSGALKLMMSAANEKDDNVIERIRNNILELCKANLLRLPQTFISEYWSAYIASMLFVLHQGESAKDILLECSNKSQNPFWLVRFAYLLCRFGYLAEQKQILRKLEKGHKLDYYIALKCAELEYSCGCTSRSQQLLRDLKAESGADLSRLVSLAKTGARTNELGIASDACCELLDTFPESGPTHIVSILKASRARALNAKGREFAKKMMKRYAQDSENSDLAIAYGFLLVELGEKEEGLNFVLCGLKKYGSDYFTLGRVGKLFQEAGLDALADEKLEKSIALRPNTFLHYDFVGNVYFSAKRFSKAQGNYKTALAIKPYLRHIQAKYLYCSLPIHIRESSLFGSPWDLELIFQRKQDFYHDLGPSTK